MNKNTNFNSYYVEQALSLLNNLISLGVEYPEAHIKAINMYSLTKPEAEGLQALYDQQG